MNPTEPKVTPGGIGSEPHTFASVSAEWSAYKTAIHAKGIGGKDHSWWLTEQLVIARNAGKATLEPLGKPAGDVCWREMGNGYYCGLPKSHPCHEEENGLMRHDFEFPPQALKGEEVQLPPLDEAHRLIANKMWPDDKDSRDYAAIVWGKQPFPEVTFQGAATEVITELLAALSAGKGQPVAEVMKDVISSLMTQVEAVEKEQGRWQDAIYKLLRKMVPDADIDGGGCDSGDALDFALEEIGQAIAALSAGKGQEK